MISLSDANQRSITRFRRKLSAAMVLVASATTILALYLTQHNVAVTATRDLQQNFQTELSGLHQVEELRQAALAERCRVLAEKPRIHAALEDNALDLLYPSAKDELRDLMEGDTPVAQQGAGSLHARFYRFLDSSGAVLSPPNSKDVGEMSPQAEAQLALKQLLETQQIGYIRENTDAAKETVHEIVAAPIFSTETGNVISALVVGFKPFELSGRGTGAGMKSGIWADNRLYLPSLSKEVRAALDNEIAKAVGNSRSAQNNFVVTINGAPQLLFTGDSILIRFFRRRTRFAFTHLPIRWRNCIGFAGKLAVRACCFCWADLWPATSWRSGSPYQYRSWRWIRKRIARNEDAPTSRSFRRGRNCKDRQDTRLMLPIS